MLSPCAFSNLQFYKRAEKRNAQLLNEEDILKGFRGIYFNLFYSAKQKTYCIASMSQPLTKSVIPTILNWLFIIWICSFTFFMNAAVEITENRSLNVLFMCTA